MKKYNTIVFSEFSSYLFYYLPILMQNRQFVIKAIYLSSHSYNNFLEIYRQGLIWQLRQILFMVRKGRYDEAKVWWFLLRNKELVIRYSKTSFKAASCDYLCSLGFMRLIPASQIELSKFSSNIHWSTLPKYIGCNPLYWSIRNNENITGVTIHQINEVFDSGDILLQESVTMSLEDCYQDVKPKLIDVSQRLFTRLLNNIAEYSVKAYAQSDLPKGHPAYWKNPDHNDFCIMQGDSYDTARSKWRAAPEGSCYVIINETRHKVVRSWQKKRMTGLLSGIHFFWKLR